MTIYIDRKSFKIARFICDAVLGTNEVTRPIEDRCLAKEQVVYFPRESHCMIHVNKQDQFWQDVKSVRAMLDKDGNYNGLSDPRAIADVIVMSGISWVTSKMVKSAQKKR